MDEDTQQRMEALIKIIDEDRDCIKNFDFAADTCQLTTQALFSIVVSEAVSGRVLDKLRMWAMNLRAQHEELKD